MSSHHFSSDQFATSRFPLHGRTEVLVQGRMLRSVAWGPFNLELAQAQVRLLSRAVLLLPEDRRYVELVEYRDSLLMPQAAWSLMSDFIEHGVRLGYCAKTTVLVGGPDVEGQALFGDRFIRLWSRSRPVECVLTRTEGEARLQALLEAFGLNDASHRSAPAHPTLFTPPVQG